jgi:hypothetical protein
MHEVLLSLDRLKRHYDVAVHTYDEVAFLDLAHTLRFWCDLKRSLKDRAPAFSESVSFKTATPARKLIRAARGCQHVFCFLGTSVHTYASNGQIAGPLKMPGYDSMTVFSKITSTPPLLEVFAYALIAKEMNEDEINQLWKSFWNPDIRRCNYNQWLDAEAVQWAYQQEDGDLKHFRVTREMLIRRVANTLGPSHPKADELTHEWDRPIHYLLQCMAANLPLPYFVLLKAAQDILECASKTIDGKYRLKTVTVAV